MGQPLGQDRGGGARAALAPSDMNTVPPHPLPHSQVWLLCFAALGLEFGCPGAAEGADSSADGWWDAGAHGVGVREKAVLHFAGCSGRFLACFPDRLFSSLLSYFLPHRPRFPPGTVTKLAPVYNPNWFISFLEPFQAYTER